MRRLVLACLLACFAPTGLLAAPAHGERFDETGWKAAEVGSAASVRLGMLDDLVASRHLRRLSRDAVHALLGKPMPYEITPDDEDYYVVEERYHDESDRMAQAYLQRHLVIKYPKDAARPSLLFIETTSDVPGTGKAQVSRVPLQ